MCVQATNSALAQHGDHYARKLKNHAFYLFLLSFCMFLPLWCALLLFITHTSLPKICIPDNLYIQKINTYKAWFRTAKSEPFLCKRIGNIFPNTCFEHVFVDQEIVVINISIALIKLFNQAQFFSAPESSSGNLI